MKNKIIALLASAMFIAGCHSSGSQSQSSAPPDEPNYSQGSVTLSGEMIDFPVTDQKSALSSIANTGSLLGIDDVSTELSDCEESEIDGIHTYRFARQHDGIPVFGASVVVCTGNDGEVLQISGIPINFDGISSEPKSGIEEVLSNLRSENGIDKDAMIFNDGLTFFINEQNQPVLCYKLFSADTEWYECLASADTGKILFQETPKTETVKCSGEDMQGQNREFPTDYESNTYYLWDYEKSIFIYDAGGETFGYIWGLADSDGRIYEITETIASIATKGLDENNKEVWFKSKDNKYIVFDTAGHEIGRDALPTVLFVRKNKSEKRSGSIKPATSTGKVWKNRKAVTVYAGLEAAYDFCKKVLGITSFDDHGGEIYGVFDDKLWNKNNNPYFRDAKNAYSRTEIWSGGNKTFLVFGKNCNYSIDTIGHEFGHSITRVTANLTYKGESGAIDEGIADVFGELIEDWDDDHNLNGSNDWIHDDRNLITPEKSKQEEWHSPSKYHGDNWFNTKAKKDNGGVHINSTVISHAAYLMSIGSKYENCTKLNNTDIAKLFYHTLKDNNLPTDVGMIEFSEKMINTARMLASQSVLDWDKVKTVIQSLAEVNLSESGSSYSSLKPDFKVEVLDPNGTLYDNYHVKIISCNGRLAAFAPAFYLTEDNDTWSLYDEFDVTTHEMPSVHLPGGYYIILLTDNQSKKIIDTFSVTVSESKGILEKLSARTEMFSSEQPVEQPIDQPIDQSVDRPDDLTDFAGAEYSPVDMADIPDGLEAFLNSFSWETSYGETGNPALGVLEYDVFDGRDAWILPEVVQWTEYSKYPITAQSRLYEYVDEEDMDWILMNIYNLPSDSIDRYKRDATPNNYNDGKYYLWGAYAGPAPSATNIQPAFNGKYYYVSYDIEWSYPGQTEPFIEDYRHYALMEYKIIDGKGYWSIYKDTVDSNALAALGIN